MNNPASYTAKTVAIVTLFNPDTDVVMRCRSLLTQVSNIIAIDDGSPRNVHSLLDELEDMGIHVIRLHTNSGIARALNAGIQRALDMTERPQFILTMDQDSLLSAGYVKQLQAAYTRAIQDGVKVGMVAPAQVSGLTTRPKGQKNGTLLGGEPIQSGLLIPAVVLEEIGQMMTELFIDGVDSEFYLRARNAGFSSVLAPQSALEHSLGTKVEASIFGMRLMLNGLPLKIRVAATDRYYYIFRNRIILARRYWRTHPLWLIDGTLRDYRHLAIVSILVPNRLMRLRSAFAGVSAGIHSITGRRP